MGFLRDQRTKWRTRLQSKSDFDTSDAPTPSPSPSPHPSPSPLGDVVFSYAGGALGLTLQRSRSKWIDDVGPTKIAWRKERRLGITFHERPSNGADHCIAVKELTVDALNHPTICVGMGLIGVNGEPIAGLPLATVMGMLRNSESPCDLAFTPPPSPILVAEISAAAASQGVTNGHVLVAVDDMSMLGCSLQEASEAISAATQDAPVTLRFAPLGIVYPSLASDATRQASDVAKKSVRNTLIIAAVAAALTV
jgi:hypothetical protein